MSIRFYTRSTDAWGAMLSAIRGATESIYIEMYIFSEDTSTTHDFVSVLMDRARHGVQVVMLLDAFGSMGLPNKIINDFKEAGVEVRFFRHWIHRTHQKTVIIDGRHALVGGVNITNHARTWNDLQIAVSGSIVRRLLKVFARTYKLSGGTQTLHISDRQLRRNHRIRMWILEHTPLASKRTLRTYYTKKLEEAVHHIVFVTPYFVPNPWLLRAMSTAITRGIRVELLVPEITDSHILDKINRYYITKAADIGVQVYITPGTNHAKAVLIDESEGLIGSANIDSLSFERNSELGIFFTDKHSTAELSSIITMWKQTATLYTPTLHALPWYYFPLAFLLKLLHPFL